MDTLDALATNVLQFFIVIIAALMVLGRLGPRHRAGGGRARRRRHRRSASARSSSCATTSTAR
jgi:hypothetical protein